MLTENADAFDAHALILAAGVGRRLGGDVSDAARKPKALLQFGGQSLLSRHVKILQSCGIEQITVVVGFGAEQMQAELQGLGTVPAVSTILNPDFREGSVVSLWAGRQVLESGASVILMDADVLYDSRLMRRLIDRGHPNCLLLDREIEPGDEPVKLCISDGRIVDFHKKPQGAYQWHGESVGFFRFTPQTAQELAARAEDYVTSGRRNMEYEEPIRDMIIANSQRFGFEDITGLPWTEIDFPEDLTKGQGLMTKLVA